MKSKRIAITLLWAALFSGCAAEVPGDDAQDWNGESPHVVASRQALQAAPIESPVLDPSADISPDSKYQCTPERQTACDTCIAGCSTLCAKNNGGGPAGGCIGLFCPTRCDACELSCYKACGKCTPSGGF
jgi:hypothetical protein